MKNQKTTNAAILREDTAKTNAHTRHFIKNDLTREMVISTLPINYRDKKTGKWKELDHTLKKSADGYTAQMGNYTAHLAGEDGKGRVEVTDGASSVFWQYLGADGSPLVPPSDTPKARTAKHPQKLKAIAGKRGASGFGVASHAVLPGDGIDLDYRMEGNRLKENIIIKEKRDVYRFRYLLRTAGFSAEKGEDGSIRFFDASASAEEAKTPVFVMHAPFMWDAEGEYCHNVQYDIAPAEGGDTLLTVTADADWINAAERFFPVCIDPQLSNNVSGSGYITTTQKQFDKTNATVCNPSGWVEVTPPTESNIVIEKTESKNILAVFHVQKAKIDLSRFRLISANLVLEKQSDRVYSSTVEIRIGDKTVTHRDTKSLTGDITDLYNCATGDFDIEMEMMTEGEKREFTKNPCLLLEYQFINARSYTKSFSAVSGTKVQLDLLSGIPATIIEDMTDSAIGISVSHVYKPGKRSSCYGQNFRLNLDETLKKAYTSETGEQYVYTDALGDKHTFTEHFYYIDQAGSKQHVTADMTPIRPDTDGRLWYQGTEIFRELVTVDGLRAMTRLENVQNIDLIEQRLDEEKQMSDQITSYKNALLNFVRVYNADEYSLRPLTEEDLNPDSFKSFLYDPAQCSFILSQEEAASLCSLQTQRALLEYERDHPSQSNSAGTSSGAGTGSDTGTADNNATTSNGAVNNEERIAQLNRQLRDVNKQIVLLRNKHNIYRKQLYDMFKAYYNLTGEYKRLKACLPVRYLLSDNLIKGFNEDGHLVLIRDNHGRYIALEREFRSDIYTSLVSSIYDKDEHTIRFRYNRNGTLQSLISDSGETVSYRYDKDGHLSEICRQKLPSVKLTYDGKASVRITNLQMGDDLAAFTYNATGMLTDISYQTYIKEISHGSATKESSPIVLSSVQFLYNTQTTTVIDHAYKTVYEIDQENVRLNAVYEYLNNQLTAGERYEYGDDNLISSISYANTAYMNSHSLDIGSYAIGKQTDITYDSFGSPACVLTVDNEQFVRTTAEYTYTADRKQESCKTTTEYFASVNMTDREPVSRSVTVQTFAYNASGDPVRIESYVEGEEQTSGREVEEHEYDANGYEVRTRTYNTLDPSSCLCTEVKLDENGRTTAEADATGEWETTFSYTPDGAVRSKRLPNGSRLAYGFDRDGSVTAITHSTEEGEENSVTRLYTADCVTELKSGNHTVRYTYDSKRRMTGLSLDGTENYAAVSYTEQSNGDEQTTVCFKNNAVSEVVKDAAGRVKQTKVKADANDTGKTVNFTYDTNGKLTKTTDSVAGNVTYTYDGKGNVTSVTAENGCAEAYTYTVKGGLATKDLTVTDVTEQHYAYTYANTAKGELTGITVDGKTVSPKTDALGRQTGKRICAGTQKIAEETVSYLKYGDHTTARPAVVRYAVPAGDGLAFRDSLRYRYNEMGQITAVFENGLMTSRYGYDALGRLVREDNTAFNQTVTYTYDDNGNRIARRKYALSDLPTEELHSQPSTQTLCLYDGDRLLSYGSDTFIYDDVGNPTTYRGKNATWAYGRQLVGLDGHTFTYDARGRRTAKDTLTFFYDDSGKLIAQSNGLTFLYDHTGLFAVKDGNVTYYCRKNPQSDILCLLDSNGNIVVKYEYDAWGNCKVCNPDGSENTDASFIGNKNPFRYRSYYFDADIGLYFLQTRYYDPETGRFLSPDDFSYLDPETVGGLNLYAYCGNNPVMRFDSSGKKWWDCIAWIGLGLVVAAATVITAGMAGAVIGGIAGGIIYGAAVGAITLSVVGAGVGAVGGMIYDATNGNDFGSSIWEWTKAGFGIGAIAGAVVGGVIGGAAASSVTGLANTSFWTGLGKEGAQIAANAAAEKGLITIGQTFGGKAVQFLTNMFGYSSTKYLWISLSKTMASSVAMHSIYVFTGIEAINKMSIFALYEVPILVERGINIMRIILGDW